MNSKKQLVKDNFVFSSQTMGEVPEALKDLQFPVIVMPITNRDKEARVFVSGGAGSQSVTFWDVNGKKLKGHNKIKSQLRTAFKKLTKTPVTIEGFITKDDKGEEIITCFDLHNSNAHASGLYQGTYEERIAILSEFLGQCSVNSKNRIFGSCIKNFFDWDELWSDVFDPDNGLAVRFPFLSIRGQHSQYVVGEDKQWMIVSNEWLYSQQKQLLEIIGDEDAEA